MAEVSLDEITLKFKDGQEKQPDARKARAYLRKNGLTVKDVVKSKAPKSGRITWTVDADKPIAPEPKPKAAPKTKAAKAKVKAVKPQPVEEETVPDPDEFDDDFFDEDD